MAAPDFNSIIDQTIKNVIPIMQHGSPKLGIPVLEPYAVPETTFHFKVINIFPGYIRFYNMALGGLSTIHRTGNCTVNGRTVSVSIGFSTLGFTGTYGIDFFPLNDIGEFASGVVNPQLNVQMVVTTSPKLEFTVSHVDLHYDAIGFVSIGANPIVDVASWLMSAVGIFMSNFFQPILSNAVSPLLGQLLQEELNKISI